MVREVEGFVGGWGVFLEGLFVVCCFCGCFLGGEDLLGILVVIFCIVCCCVL